MSVVTEYLTKIVQKNLDEFGIVIWYDPRECYRSFIEKLSIDVPVLTYQGSYFELRHLLEPYLKGRERQKVLVYVPMDHNESASPLIEAEYWGTILKPGGPTGKNTKLEIIARNALSEIFDPETISNYEKSIQLGTLTLDDLDTLTETHQETGKTGSLALIFPNTVPVDIILNFLTDLSVDEKIEQKQAFDEFRSFVSAHTGFESDTHDLQEFRRNLSRYILISDFLAKIKEPKIFHELEKIPKSRKKGHSEFCKNSVKEWQCRRDLQDSYLETAEKVELAYELSSLEIPIKPNIALDTFPFFEMRVSDQCIDFIMNENFSEALKIIDTRKQLFWADVDYRNTRLLWHILSLATDLNRLAKMIKGSLKGSGKLSPVKIIEKYTELSDPDAWFHLDLLNRHFERAYSDYDDPPSDEGSPIALLVLKSRNTYSETINLLAETYSDILVKNKFSYKGVLSQREIFSKILSPHLTQGKTVYFLIDAFRYEMGVDLFQSLNFEHKKIQPAIATPPTITPIGMAALLPGAHTSFGILIGGSPAIGVQINDTILKTREDRINYLQEHAPGKIAVIKLDETQKISKSTEKKIKTSDLVVVTTQEIDNFSTYKDNKELVRHIMSLVLGQIKRGINNLVQMGFRNFVITADHGHIFGDSIGSENRIDPPGGDTLYLDRRSWIGKGGESQESYLRVKPEAFAINGNFEYAFPKSIACFRAKGDLVFFHGGLSLQESIIPVIEVVADVQKEKSPEKGLKFEISYSKEKISNRFFSIEARFDWKEVLIGPEQCAVRIEFIVEGKEGRTVSASYGLNENTGEITLKRNEPCHITLMLPEGILQSKTTIYLIDADTSKELYKIENLKISLSL